MTVGRKFALRLRKVARLLQHPKLIPLPLLGVLPALEHEDAFHGLEFDMVIDVGANKGQFAAFAATRWPQARLICFEPLPGPRTKLEKVLRRLAAGRWEIRDHALGSRVGRTVMHVASREDSSSLLPLGADQKRWFGMEETGVVPVEVGVLANEPGLQSGGRVLLKLDVQGFEFDVLKGVGAAMKWVDAVYAECSFVELYEGQKLADQIQDLLNEGGFEARGAFQEELRDGKVIQADMLFVRPESSKVNSA